MIVVNDLHPLLGIPRDEMLSRPHVYKYISIQREIHRTHIESIVIVLDETAHVAYRGKGKFPFSMSATSCQAIRSLNRSSKRAPLCARERTVIFLLYLIVTGKYDA